MYKKTVVSEQYLNASNVGIQRGIPGITGDVFGSKYSANQLLKYHCFFIAFLFHYRIEMYMP